MTFPLRPRERPSVRVEMVLPALYKAGMEVMAARLARGLKRRGHDVGFTCIQPGDAFADELRDEGYRVSVVAAPGLRSIVRAPGLTSWFAQLQPDVVHIHSGAWLKGARAARHAGVSRVIHTEHGMLEGESWYHPTLKHLAARFTDEVVAVAEPIREYLIQVAKVRPAKLRVILNGVDTDQFTPSQSHGPGDVRRRLGLSRAELLIGNVARLTPIKNHALLIDAFAVLRARGDDARLAIVGEGPLRQALETRIGARGVEARITLLGEMHQMADVYRDLDLFVLSSAIEGTSLSILEAMASGVCVVATDVGGNADVLGHGRYGVLVPSDDVAALAKAMSGLLRDPVRRRRLATAAREHVTTRYSEHRMIQAYEALYLDRTTGICAA